MTGDSETEQSVGGGQRLAERCPGCGMDGPFRGGGRFTRKRTSSTLEGDGKVETWERWKRVECPDCDTVFATLEKTVRTRYSEDEKEHKVLTDGGEPVSQTNRHGSDPPAIVEEWAARAKANIEEWGLQDHETLLLAIQEELGELTQAYLEADHEGGSTATIDEELADLAALVIQLHYRQAEDHWIGESEIVTDGGQQAGNCAVCGALVTVDGDEAMVREGRIIGDCCRREPVAYLAECLDCNWTFRAEWTEFHREQAKQAAQQKANQHERERRVIDDTNHTAVWREVDPDGAGEEKPVKTDGGRPAQDGSEDQQCGYRSCDRLQYEDKTTSMYKKSEVEEDPDDVRQQPICYRHWVFTTVLKEYPQFIIAVIIIPVLYLITDHLLFSFAPLLGLLIGEVLNRTKGCIHA